MKEQPFITVGEPSYAVGGPGELYMTIKIDTFSSQVREMQPVIVGIAEAVSKYVEKEKAAEIFRNIEMKVAEQVYLLVEKEVARRSQEILSKLDMQAMANLAAIGFAKALGERVAKR